MDAHGNMPQAVPRAPLSRRSPIWRFIVDRNPFYLLSAVMMFAGVRVILSALQLMPGDLKHLLLLIGVLNAYEAMVIALALYLITRRGLVRDGWILLSIEALFLIDLTFLNAELFTANLRWGTWINGLCFVLALVKIGVVIRTLRLRLTPPEWVYVAAQMAAIFFMAGAFKELSRHHRQPGALSAITLYGTWWLVGGLLVAGTVLLRKPADRLRSASAMWALSGRLYLMLPFVSLLVHLCGANRVYWVHFHAANAAPALLGLAVFLSRWRGEFGRRLLTTTQCVLTVLAVLVSLPYPLELMVHAGSHLASPLRLSLIGSAAVMIMAFFQNRHLIAIQIAAAATVAATLGNSVQEMQLNALALARAIYRGFYRAVPETPMHWGLLAVLGSFLMLALGASISLRKRPAEEAASTTS